MSELRFETTLPSGRRLSLYQGDLTEEATDAIVNAANSMLANGGGVAGAIVRKGGKVIQEECDRIGRTKTGRAAITGAGRLPAKFVIHAVGPIYKAYSPAENDRLLAAATTAALEIAREKGLESIAFPAISAGIFGFPKDRCAHVKLGAVCEWAAAHPNDGHTHVPWVPDIRFVIIDAETVGAFEKEFRKRFAET